jgi:hypothetical protein
VRGWWASSANTTVDSKPMKPRTAMARTAPVPGPVSRVGLSMVQGMPVAGWVSQVVSYRQMTASSQISRTARTALLSSTLAIPRAATRAQAARAVAHQGGVRPVAWVIRGLAAAPMIP